MTLFEDYVDLVYLYHCCVCEGLEQDFLVLRNNLPLPLSIMFKSWWGKASVPRTRRQSWSISIKSTKPEETCSLVKSIGGLLLNQNLHLQNRDWITVQASRWTKVTCLFPYVNKECDRPRPRNLLSWFFTLK